MSGRSEARPYWADLSWSDIDLASLYDEKWDLTGRIHTQTKLQILAQYYDIWLKIWNNQNWVNRDWYYIDLFAGRGIYSLKTSDQITYWPGSPIIFLNCFAQFHRQGKFKRRTRVHLILVEKRASNAGILQTLTHQFLGRYPELRDLCRIQIIQGDCNEVIHEVCASIPDKHKTLENPLFIFIDPYGLQIKVDTLRTLLGLPNRKDIMFNFILEGVQRVRGFAERVKNKENVAIKELKTLKTLEEFMGADVNVIPKDSLDMLRFFVEKNFPGMKVVAYDMPYPHKRDVIYYLIFASRKGSITQIVKDVYARMKQRQHPSIWGPEIYKKTFFLSRQITATLLHKKEYTGNHFFIARRWNIPTGPLTTS